MSLRDNPNIIEEVSDLRRDLDELASNMENGGLVTTDMIDDGAVTNDKIADSAITPDKIDTTAYPCGRKTYWAATNYTATTDRNLGDVTITLAKPARLMIHAWGILKTSRYTSHIQVRVDGTTQVDSSTNLTSFITVEGYGVVELTAGTHTLAYWMGGQDSGTTASLASYASHGFAWWCV